MKLNNNKIELKLKSISPLKIKNYGKHPLVKKEITLPEKKYQIKKY